jgi:hypothetical protein
MDFVENIEIKTLSSKMIASYKQYFSGKNIRVSLTKQTLRITLNNEVLFNCSITLDNLMNFNINNITIMNKKTFKTYNFNNLYEEFQTKSLDLKKLLTLYENSIQTGGKKSKKHTRRRRKGKLVGGNFIDRFLICLIGAAISGIIYYVHEEQLEIRGSDEHNGGRPGYIFCALVIYLSIAILLFRNGNPIYRLRHWLTINRVRNQANGRTNQANIRRINDVTRDDASIDSTVIDSELESNQGELESTQVDLESILVLELNPESNPDLESNDSNNSSETPIDVSTISLTFYDNPTDRNSLLKNIRYLIHAFTFPSTVAPSDL